jgi:hypothetical protein
MDTPLTCKHCQPDEQGDYKLPGPWRNLYAYYDHLSVDHGLFVKRHCYSVKVSANKVEKQGEQESVPEAATRIQELLDLHDVEAVGQLAEMIAAYGNATPPKKSKPKKTHA